MAHEFKQTRRVEFADTDMAGIMHFSNFFRFMEQTEHEFYRSLGLSVHPHAGKQVIGWPRVHAACEYAAPLRFEDNVEIELVVREKRSKSIIYDFIFRKLDGADSTAVARGTMTVVCVTFDRETRTMKATTIPRAYAEKIHAAPKKNPSKENQ